MKLNVNQGFTFGTNINNIVVPDALRRRIATGLDYFDGVAGGQGLTPSSVILFTGTPGAGKTTMMLTLADALNAQGVTSVFNTGEESLYQVKMTAERLGLDSGFAVGEEVMVPELLKGCDKLMAANPDKPFVLIIDSLQTMNDGKYGINTNSSTAERALEMITDWCKLTNACAIVIGQVGKDGTFSGKNKLKHMIDAMCEMWVDDDKKSEFYGLRVMEMTKNRFGGAGVRFYLEMTKQGFEFVDKVPA